MVLLEGEVFIRSGEAVGIKLIGMLDRERGKGESRVSVTSQAAWLIEVLRAWMSQKEAGDLLTGWWLWGVREKSHK